MWEEEKGDSEFCVRFREIIDVDFKYDVPKRIDKTHMIVQHVNIYGAFGELFELDNYPFDVQDLTMYIECKQPTNVVWLQWSNRYVMFLFLTILTAPMPAQVPDHWCKGSRLVGSGVGTEQSRQCRGL